MDLFEENTEEEDGEDSNPAFQKVYDCQEVLQTLIDAGGGADQTPEASLAAIKNAAQELHDAINDLSLEDLSDEFDTEDALDADSIFSEV